MDVLGHSISKIPWSIFLITNLSAYNKILTCVWLSSACNFLAQAVRAAGKKAMRHTPNAEMEEQVQLWTLQTILLKRDTRLSLTTSLFLVNIDIA